MDAGHLKAIQAYLLSEMHEEPDPSYEFFPGFLSINGITAFAQHHEYPTNFIDFTFNPLVALYFASRKSDRASFTEEKMEGHGVIFECFFSNFDYLSKKNQLRLELGLVPPAHVPRLYQQQGFFIDCGDITNSTAVKEIELASERIYFPREYPVIKDSDNVFSEKFMIKHLGNEIDIFRSHQTNDMETKWYMAYQFYTSALELLIQYSEQNMRRFDIAEAVSLMKEKNKYSYPPWERYSKSLSSKARQAINLADHLSKAALLIYNVAKVYGYNSSELDESLVKAYAAVNPALFCAIFEIASQVDLYNLRELAKAIGRVEGIKEIVADSLTDIQLKQLRKLPPIRYL